MEGKTLEEQLMQERGIFIQNTSRILGLCEAAIRFQRDHYENLLRNAKMQESGSSVVIPQSGRTSEPVDLSRNELGPQMSPHSAEVYTVVSEKERAERPWINEKNQMKAEPLSPSTDWESVCADASSMSILDITTSISTQIVEHKPDCADTSSMSILDKTASIAMGASEMDGVSDVVTLGSEKEEIITNDEVEIDSIVEYDSDAIPVESSLENDDEEELESVECTMEDDAESFTMVEEGKTSELHGKDYPAEEEEEESPSQLSEDIAQMVLKRIQALEDENAALRQDLQEAFSEIASLKKEKNLVTDMHAEEMDDIRAELDELRHAQSVNSAKHAEDLRSRSEEIFSCVEKVQGTLEQRYASMEAEFGNKLQNLNEAILKECTDTFVCRSDYDYDWEAELNDKETRKTEILNEIETKIQDCNKRTKDTWKQCLASHGDQIDKVRGQVEALRKDVKKANSFMESQPCISQLVQRSDYESDKAVNYIYIKTQCDKTAQGCLKQMEDVCKKASSTHNSEVQNLRTDVDSLKKEITNARRLSLPAVAPSLPATPRMSALVAMVKMVISLGGKQMDPILLKI
ncbi:uncharacterized protein LOC129588357 [Paramacrobiotus metropolitanus]|uniref:uncharacterized protein LOC129588357 n=1 Tax=Paramacrobiotus metropolitanus TaxID=2943436 RepID=UPI0024459DF3|nr:uncharacterized protein LOC129588357 [Paramacrobiotus metropolitanus]